MTKTKLVRPDHMTDAQFEAYKRTLATKRSKLRQLDALRATVRAGERAQRSATKRAKAKQLDAKPRSFTTRGTARGSCGHTHATLVEAFECLRADFDLADTFGGRSDRNVVPESGTLTHDEVAQLDALLVADGERERECIMCDNDGWVHSETHAGEREPCPTNCDAGRAYAQKLVDEAKHAKPARKARR